MKIGITEAGDASLDYTWVEKEPEMDMMILITKNVTDEFIKTVLPFAHKTIVHATCTGYGGTKIEPNVPTWKTQCDQVRKLLAYGFPANQIVLRIDPIIPTTKGLAIVEKIVEYVQPDIKRFRISVLDNYKHVQERFKEAGMPVLYNGEFQASDDEFQQLDLLIGKLKFNHNAVFESCAEPKLTRADPVGCVNANDMKMLGLKAAGGRKKQNRGGCLCAAGKTEMLPFDHYCFCVEKQTETSRAGACKLGDCKTCEHLRMYGCAHRCAYCYWKT